jgi:hypothetical protein
MQMHASADGAIQNRSLFLAITRRRPSPAQAYVVYDEHSMEGRAFRRVESRLQRWVI